MRIFPTLLLMAALSATPALAQNADPVQQQNSNAVWFENWGGLSNATMKIVAPDGKFYEIFAAAGTPVFQLPNRDVPDGVYRYELSAATTERVKIVNQIDNGRGENAKDDQAVSFHTGGQFVVSRGVIIRPKDVQEEG